MSGWKTVLFNGGVAVLLALLQWAVGYDWTQVVSPTVAGLIVTAVNIVLRWVTTTPIFQGKTP